MHETQPIIPPQEAIINPLSPAETEVLELVSIGMSVDKAAKARDTLPSTIKEQLRFVYKKLGAESRAHAVRIAVEIGALGFEPQQRPLFTELTPKERVALELMSLGFTRQEAASARGVSIETIKTTNRKVMWKLGAQNRAHAVRRGFEVGLFSYPPSPEGVSAIRIGALLMEKEVQLSGVCPAGQDSHAA